MRCPPNPKKRQSGKTAAGAKATMRALSNTSPEHALALAARVLEAEAQAITSLISRLDAPFLRALDLLVGCRGRVVVTGMGKSGIIGKKISATLASTGTPALFLHPAEGIHGDLGMVSASDVVIGLSNSGETEELVKILPMIKRLKAPLICLTGNVSSTLAKYSDVVIDVGVTEEAGPLEVVPTSSTAAAMAMGDALAVALMERRGFKADDFAMLHPGGTLGRRLLLRVEDAMHVGDAIPRVRPSTPMQDVILEMTSKKLGCTTVCESDGRLAGIVTDGDLRRLLQKQPHDAFRLTASDVMTAKPKTIARDALAAKAVQVMEEHAILVLVVIDRRQQVEGILHLHDLLKLGVV
jgi:arabinose-5-phosphate isomerase